MVFSTWSVHSTDAILLGPRKTMEGFNGVGIRWDVAIKKSNLWAPVLDQFAGGWFDQHSLRPMS